MDPKTIKRWVCPRDCGWYREWNDEPAYLNSQYIHPFYGLVSGKECMERDIHEHICGLYRLARSHAPKAQVAVRALRAVS
jgi:hypothetical protein